MPRSDQSAAEATSRRIMRESRRAARVADRFAQCGFRYYSQSPAQRETGAYWKACHGCNRTLDYQEKLVTRECVR